MLNSVNINANNIMFSGNYGFGQGLRTGLRAYGDIMFNQNTILGQLQADLNAYYGGNVNFSGNTVDPYSNQRGFSSPASYFHGGMSQNYLLQNFRPQLPVSYPQVAQYQQASYQYQPQPQYQAPIYIPQAQYAMPGTSAVASVAGPGASARAVAGFNY